MLEDMKFRTKLTLGNGIVLVLVIIISIVLYQSINFLDETSNWVNHTHDVIGKGNSLVGAMVDQETGMRGFMFTGNDEFLEPYNAGKKKFKTVITNLKKLVSDNPEQVTRLTEIEKLAGDWQKNAAIVQIEKRRAVVRGETTFNDLIGLVNQKKGKTFMDGIRSKSAEFIGVEQKLMETRAGEFNLAVRRGNFFSFYGTMFVIILGVFVIIFVTVSLMKQLGGEEPKIIMTLASTITKGDLTSTSSDSNLSNAGLVGAMREMSMKLEAIVSEVKAAAGSVSSGSEQLNSSAQQLSASTTQQAASTQELSASMEEMRANISQNTENAGKTEKIATKSAIDAEKGGKAVSETVTAINRIGETIDVIDGIADKIELLALNASIEAARAGEHGKGFAVVANAIKELAIKSKDSATEIIGLVRDSVKIAIQAGSMLDQLVPDIQNTAQLVQEISASSREQNSGANQINKAIFEVEEANQRNSSSSQQLAITANQLSIQASQLQASVDFFKLSQETNEKNNSRTIQNDTLNQPTVTTISTPNTDQPGLEDKDFKRLTTGGQE